jgi:hypothetical protein
MIPGKLTYSKGIGVTEAYLTFSLLPLKVGQRFFIWCEMVSTKQVTSSIATLSSEFETPHRPILQGCKRAPELSPCSKAKVLPSCSQHCMVTCEEAMENSRLTRPPPFTVSCSSHCERTSCWVGVREQQKENWKVNNKVQVEKSVGIEKSESRLLHLKEVQ